MNYFWNFYKTHKFGVTVFLIILLAFILRFYNYENRWGLAYDQARDVLVARDALKSFKLPLVGPFASAGQFVYGPQWFWILMGMVSVYPYSVITPWAIQTLLYVGIVGLMITIGKDLQDKRFGLIVGILTAISTAQLAQSTNLTSPSMVGFFSVVSLYFFVRYIKTGSIKNAFWMAFMIATAINIHFQAIGLLVLILMAVIFKKNSFKKIVTIVIGIIIPFIPLIIFDLKNSFFESKNMLQYYLHDQYKISLDVLGRRWLTYAGVFWPNAWAHIIGGRPLIGYIEIICLVAVTIYSFLRRSILKEWYMLIISFLSMFTLIRYTRTPLFDSYLAFLHPFVLIFTGWVIIQMLKINRFVGLALFFIIFIFTLKADLSQIKNGENFTAIQTREWRDVLINKYPNKKFSVYDYQYGNVQKSLPLVLFLESKNKVDDKGLKVGFYIATSKTRFKYESIVGNRGGYQILNLDATSSSHLSLEGWAPINPSQIYRSTVEWYRK